MSVFGFRALRVNPGILDEKIATLVKNLKAVEFLKGTHFEARFVAMGVDPYSILIGMIIGSAAVLLLGAVTLELWLPAYLSRLTGRTIAEATKAITVAIAGV